MPKKPGLNEEVFPLKLTSAQRESFRATRVRRKLMDRIKAAPEGTQVIEFSKKELDHLDEEVGTSTRFAPSPERQHLVAVRKKITRLLDAISGNADKPKRRRPVSASDLLFQFKITLLGIAPSIWRRIQVEDGTLGDLHLHIQRAFGWWNYHLHQFLIDEDRYGPDLGDDFELETSDESKVRLSRVLPKSGERTRWEYEYDFGDGWRHEVLFEGYPPKEKGTKYPVCLEGARACPQEDVGGPWGYTEYLEAMAAPRAPRGVHGMAGTVRSRKVRRQAGDEGDEEATQKR